MSYSVCLNCKKMVSSYEKYCGDCVEKHNLQSEENYWKDNQWPDDDTRFSILMKDAKATEKLDKKPVLNKEEDTVYDIDEQLPFNIEPIRRGHRLLCKLCTWRKDYIGKKFSADPKTGKTRKAFETMIERDWKNHWDSQHWEYEAAAKQKVLEKEQLEGSC